MSPEDRIAQLEAQVSEPRDGMATVCLWLQESFAHIAGLRTGVAAIIKAHDNPEHLAPILGAEQQFSLEHSGGDDIGRHYLKEAHDHLSAALLLALLANRATVPEVLPEFMSDRLH